MGFASRLAVRADVPALTAVMDAAIAELQRCFLDEEQIEASRSIMGLDTQLIDDGTYFVVEAGEEVAGCGGWSRRETLFGGDHSSGFRPIERLAVPAGGLSIPCVRMEKPVDPLT